VDFPKPNEIRGLKPGGSKTIEVSTDYTGCSAEERCPVFIKVHTEVPVPAVQFHLSKAQDFMSGSFDFFPGPPGNGKSPLTFEGRVVSFGGSEVDQSPKSQNGTALLVPAAQYQGPSVSKAFYLAFILSDLSPVTVIATAPVWKTLDLSKTISIETSPIAQTWELPFQKDLYVVSVLVTQQDCTLGEDSGWLFGGGGLQTVTFENPEPRGLLCGVQEWFYSRGEFSDLPEQSSFFLVVPAFSSPGTVFLEKEPVQFICDDIISCHGNGICSRDDGQCKCLKGTGFSFSGDQCQTLHRGSTWVILIVIASIILSVCLGHLWCSNSRLRKDKVLPLLINEPSSQSPQRISVTLDHVSFVLPSGKELLKDVSAHLAAGSLSAVMGPSGSGKSTLLKVMNRSISCSSGKILLNGIVVEKVKNVTSVIACVPQDDILRPCLTVFETLLFSAELRLSPHYSLKEKRRLVEFILDCVGLVEQRNMLVGDIGASKLSGGQRKRVSIAQELIAFPSALFLDEPTSGLDSTAALSLISMLRNEIVQKLGITVCCVIHQPRYDILQLFDNVLVLETGTLRYFGSPALSALSEKLPRLPSMLNDEKEQRFLNPADVILDFVSEFKAPQFEAAPLSQDVLVSPQVPSFLSQVWVQIKRSSLEILRSTQQLVTMYGLTLFVALLLSFLYNQSRFAGPAPSTDVRKCPKIFQGLCASNRNDNFVAQASIVSLALGLAAAASSLTVFGGIEKKVYARESRSGVSNVAYLLAKEVTALPNLVLASLLFVSVFQWITATPISVVTFCIIAFGVYFSCSGAAYLFSVAFLDSISLILTVVYVAVMTSLSGAQPLLPELEKTIGGSLGKVIPSISYSRFSTEAFYLGVLETFKDIYDLDWAFSVHGYAFEDMTSCLLVPFVIGLVFRVVSGVVLIHGSSFQTFIQRVSKKAKPC
jgi:ABC-type multidrug transport system ATPase subunit